MDSVIQTLENFDSPRVHSLVYNYLSFYRKSNIHPPTLYPLTLTLPRPKFTPFTYTILIIKERLEFIHWKHEDLIIDLVKTYQLCINYCEVMSCRPFDYAVTWEGY